ncbi:hypothetical protein [Leptospira weilii]|uniref:hypothetical protein n=1 Tax=Leptospira weilii TaxID=28184 RepID=UPI003299548F
MNNTDACLFYKERVPKPFDLIGISADRCNFSCVLGQVQNLKKDKMNEKNIYDFTNHGTFSLFL